MTFRRTMCVLGATALTGALSFAAAPVASADQTRNDQWALEALQAESAWSVTKGEGVTVAVIDTGVNGDHIDLANNVLQGRDFIDGDADATPDSSEEDPSHGTEMAGIIAGHGHGAAAEDGVMGLAPGAKILPIRKNVDDQSGYAEEIRYAVDHGASVINISGYVGVESAADREAAEYAIERDVLVVAGAGNQDKVPEILYPAKYPGVLTVAGVSDDGTFWQGSNQGSEVLLAAPATRIVSTGWPNDKLRISDGTSNATAFVSAAAALLKSEFPDLTAGQIANQLVKTAALPDSAEGISLPDERYGYGVIRPFAALTEDIPAGSRYGPLKITEDEPSAAASGGRSDADYAAEKKEADQKQLIVFVALAAVILLVLGFIVWFIVRSSRRNRSGPGGPASPGAYPPYGQQAAPQQYPYRQSVHPQQNPYQQQPPAPPQGQWPPQR